MAREIRKRQPLDKTIVTEFKVQVADIHARRTKAQGSIAKRVNIEGSFRSGDETVTTGRPFVIDNIQTAVLVHAYTDIVLDLKYKDQEIVSVPCSGLFMLYGELESVTVRAKYAAEAVRFIYLSA